MVRTLGAKDYLEASRTCLRSRTARKVYYSLGRSSIEQSAITPKAWKSGCLTSGRFVIRYVGLGGVRTPNPIAGGCEFSGIYLTDTGGQQYLCGFITKHV
jgi:hypothetical protein